MKLGRFTCTFAEIRLKGTRNQIPAGRNTCSNRQYTLIPSKNQVTFSFFHKERKDVKGAGLFDGALPSCSWRQIKPFYHQKNLCEANHIKTVEEWTDYLEQKISEIEERADPQEQMRMIAALGPSIQ